MMVNKTGIRHLSFGSTVNDRGYRYQRYTVTLVIEGHAVSTSFGISAGQYTAYCNALDYLKKHGQPIPTDRHAHYVQFGHDKF